MKPILLLSTLLFLSMNAQAAIIKKIQFDTYLRHFDHDVSLKCHQGNSDIRSFPTSSDLELHSIVLSTPSMNETSYRTTNMNIGAPCADLIKQFNSFKNEHGTIPVTVTMTVSTGASHDTYTLAEITGDNVGSRVSTHDLIHEKIEFSVGPFQFSSFQTFGILKKVFDETIIDLTPKPEQ